MESSDRWVRHSVYAHFLEHATAPSAEDVAHAVHLGVSEVKKALARLDRLHQLKLLEGTSRVLMAFPFSAIATPYRVTRGSGRRYFANCAWDAIAFHAMLEEPIRVDSFCDLCGAEVRFRLEGGRGIAIDRGLPRVRLALPAAEWWKDITRTCSNTMVFLGVEEEAGPGRTGGPSGEPGIVTVDQAHRMGLPIYSGKLRLEYERPRPSVVQATFDGLGLTGPFWRL